MIVSIACASAAPPPLRRRRTRTDRGHNEHPGDTPPNRSNRITHPNATAALHRNADVAISQTMDQIDGYH